MKTNWGIQVEQLEGFSLQLTQLSERLPQFTYSTFSINTQEFIKSFKEIITQLQFTVENEIDPTMFAIHSPNITNMLNQLPSYIANFISTTGANPHADQLVNAIWSLRSSLFWLMPYLTTSKLPLDIYTPNEKKRINEISLLNKELIRAFDLVNSHTKFIELAKEKTNGLISLIEQYSIEASNSKTNAESNALFSASTKEKLESILTQLEIDKSNASDLLIHLERTREKAESILGTSSQAALATAFSNRKERLEKSQKFWILFFTIGLLSLLGISYLSFVTQSFLTFPELFQDGKFNPLSAISRLALPAPVIWFSWFSVKQYNKNTALIEDYAFKEASALAFIGYKKDMQDDSEMSKLLSESAIRNFAFPPSRLISTKETHSPLHELIDYAMKDKGAMDKIIDLLKTINPKKTD